MVRIHNPVKSGTKGPSGPDQQLHGGTMETVDQASNLLANIIGIGDDTEPPKKNTNTKNQ